MDYLSFLEADHRRLADVTRGKLDAAVATCPEWTVGDLLGHVARVYLHKVECMRRGALPKPWPPDLSGEPVEELLERARAELVAEFAARGPAAPAYTFYGPDQTVGFWLRRMAHETVIHRIDGELAVGADSMPIPEELAVDGIDELLQVFLAWASREWPEDFAEILAGGGPGSFGIVAILTPAGASPATPGLSFMGWEVGWDRAGIAVEREANRPAGASITGTPDAIMRWLWRRSESGVTINGDNAQVAQMRQILAAATQ